MRWTTQRALSAEAWSAPNERPALALGIGDSKAMVLVLAMGAGMEVFELLERRHRQQAAGTWPSLWP